jgi:LmeA-like phospholipid-binding
VFRRFLIAVLIFLIAVLVAADRLGAIVAAHVMAGKIQTDEHLQHRPDASINGFPFLTQALGGDYKNVTVTASGIVVDGVTVTTVTARLHGVHVPFSQVWHQTVTRVPVDRIDGSALIAFDAVDNYLSAHHPAHQVVSLEPKSGAGVGADATVIDRLHVHGKTVTLRGVGKLSVLDNVVRVTVSHLRAATPGTQVLGGITRLSFSVPLKGLPFQIQLQSVTISATGITVTGHAQNVVLDS